jgi:hypothetical protein
LAGRDLLGSRHGCERGCKSFVRPSGTSESSKEPSENDAARGKQQSYAVDSGNAAAYGVRLQANEVNAVKRGKEVEEGESENKRQKGNEEEE